MKSFRNLIIGALLVSATLAFAQPHQVQSLLGSGVLALYKPDGIGVTNLDSTIILPGATRTNTVNDTFSLLNTNVATIEWSNTVNLLRYSVVSTNISAGSLGTTNGVVVYDNRWTTNGYVLVQNSYDNLFSDAYLWADRQGSGQPSIPGAASTEGTNSLYGILISLQGQGSTNNRPYNFRFSLVPDGTYETTGTPVVSVAVTANGTKIVNSFTPIPEYIARGAKKLRLQSLDATAYSTTNDCAWIYAVKLCGFRP